MANTASLENDRGPIYQWLSTVQDQDQRGHRNAAEKKQQGVSAAVMTGIPLIPLESPEALRGIRRSTRKKQSLGHLDQSRTSPTPQSPTRDEGRSKRARHSYERQPRRKTRDDHYEYKAPSAAGSRPHACKGRAKNVRGRRHTLNDLQTVNVTGNRLTIPNRANSGIFNKGKTSSAAEHPTNRPSVDISREVPRKRPKRNAAESDLAFSEMDFLSRRKNISQGPTLEGPEDTPCVQHAKRSQLNTLLYSHSKDVSNNALVQASKSYPGLRQQVDVSPTPLSSFAVAPPNKIPLGSKHSLCASPGIRLSKGEVSEKSSSPPYPWPESKSHDTLDDLPLQQYLLELLHTGLDPKTVSGVASDSLATFRHWSLSELWVLLEERKASWSTETDNKQQASPRPKPNEGSMKQALHAPPKSTTPPQPGFVCADTNERFQAYPNPRDASEPSRGVHRDSFELRHSVLEEKKTDRRQTQEQCALDFPLQAIDDCKTSDVLMENRLSLPLALELTKVEHLSTFSQYGSSTDAPVFDLGKLNRVADDDMFYETLDAAYHSILHPEAAGQEFVPDELELPILFGSSTFNEPVDLYGTPKSAQCRSSAIPVQVVKTEQIPQPTLAQNIKQDRVGTGLLGVNHQNELPQNDRVFNHNRSLPWLTGYNNSQSHIPTSRILDRNQGPALFGFWRQNKLY